jgi:hypothetical protein
MDSWDRTRRNGFEVPTGRGFRHVEAAQPPFSLNIVPMRPALLRRRARLWAEPFARSDFARLAAALKAIKGHFILPINDHPEIRRLFAWARIERASVKYRVRHVKTVHELVICGPSKRHPRELR